MKQINQFAIITLANILGNSIKMILKKITLPMFIIFCFAGFNIPSQIIPGDRINGVWLTENKDGKVEIYRTNNTYTGKLIWGRYLLDENGKPKHDVNNPDPKLKTRLLQDLVFITGLVYENEKWDDGKIYDSTTGKTYNVSITLKGKNMYLRGYIGIPLLGKTTIWQRLDD